MHEQRASAKSCGMAWRRRAMLDRPQRGQATATAYRLKHFRRVAADVGLRPRCAGK